jgi:hypothetical protein
MHKYVTQLFIVTKLKYCALVTYQYLGFHLDLLIRKISWCTYLIFTKFDLALFSVTSDLCLKIFFMHDILISEHSQDCCV